MATAQSSAVDNPTKEVQSVKSDEASSTSIASPFQDENVQSESRVDQGVVKQATIEDDMKQLVGSVSSWWSGFSKKSQEQINEVRASIDSQGGLISIAKREAAKFEAQLNEAQKAARQDVTAKEGEESIAGIGDGQISENAKGKGKQVEGDDGAEVERLEVMSKRKSNQTDSSERRASNDAVSRAIASSATGDAFFDADAFNDGGGGDMKAIDDAILATRQNAQSAMQSMQSFWGKVQSDPRVNKMQASVAKALQDISLPKQSNAVDEDGKEDPSQSPRTKRNVALPDLSKQFQTAFPNLDLKESQVMAKRYFQMSQDAARDWGKEMSTMMSDLVKVVPPEEGELGNQEKKVSDMNAIDSKSVNAGKKGVSTTSKTAAINKQHLANQDEDDFDWDREVDTSSSGLETTTGPPTTSWEDSDDQQLTSQVQTVSEAEEQSAKKAEQASKGSSKTTSNVKKVEQEEDEEDSDWE